VGASVGLDIGDRQSHVSILADDGTVLSESRIATTLDAMRQFFAGLRRTRIALEAGTHSGWASRLLNSLGNEVIVANPRELRKIHLAEAKHWKASEDKSDQEDSMVCSHESCLPPFGWPCWCTDRRLDNTLLREKRKDTEKIYKEKLKECEDQYQASLKNEEKERPF
jgi:hypothetical protein